MQLPVLLTSMVVRVAPPSRHALHGTALVVEDAASDRLLLKRLLEAMGLRCDTAPNGLEGVSAALAGTYDFVFMDILMPHMDGLQATRFLHEKLGPRSPFIVAVTGLRSERDQERFLAAGMDYVLPKPVRRAALARLLQD